MKRLFISCLFLLSIASLKAQYTVRLVVNSVGAATKNFDNIYVAGNFNNWNAADNSSKLKPFGGSRFIIVFDDVKPGLLEYKFTRGDWSKVETTAKGEEVENRTATINNDTTITVSIEGWKDNFPVKVIPNTASANVHLIDSSFFIPQLNRYRRIMDLFACILSKRKK